MKEPIVAVLFVLLMIAGVFTYVSIYDQEAPRQLRLTLDEPADRVFLRLRNDSGEAVAMMNGGPTVFTSSSVVEEMSGGIRIEWPDFSRTDCVLDGIALPESGALEIKMESRTCPGGSGTNDGF